MVELSQPPDLYEQLMRLQIQADEIAADLVARIKSNVTGKYVSNINDKGVIE